MPGSRQQERETTRVNELGREVLFSLMPEAEALPVRGGYLTQGDFLATPRPWTAWTPPRGAPRPGGPGVPDAGDRGPRHGPGDRHPARRRARRARPHGAAGGGLLGVLQALGGGPAVRRLHDLLPSQRVGRPGDRPRHRASRGGGGDPPLLPRRVRRSHAGTVPVLLCVRDQRLTATDTPRPPSRPRPRRPSTRPRPGWPTPRSSR